MWAESTSQHRFTEFVSPSPPEEGKVALNTSAMQTMTLREKRSVDRLQSTRQSFAVVSILQRYSKTAGRNIEWSLILKPTRRLHDEIFKEHTGKEPKEEERRARPMKSQKCRQALELK